MALRNKTYVAFDADNDMNFYQLMKAWDANDNIDFDFDNAHNLTTIRSWSSEDAIKASLRERMKRSSELIVLIGDNTRFCSTYVKWEIELAIKQGLPIIAVNLNQSRVYDKTLTPAALRDKIAIHISFGPKIMAYALDNWPNSHSKHELAGEIEPYHYKDHIYKNLGM